jgi:7-cyano-7-deazaguanine synthase
MKNKNCILLLSGGIDSTTLLAQLSKKGYIITALCFNYNQKHSIEIEYAKTNSEFYKINRIEVVELYPSSFNTSGLVSLGINLNKYQPNKIAISQDNSYVPFRNLIFLSYALSYAEALKIKEVYIGVNKDDAENFWDCSAHFIKMINKIAKINTDIKIFAPFIKHTKSEIIKFAKTLNVDLKKTMSCYEPVNGKACGTCLSCVKKEVAIQKAECC